MKFEFDDPDEDYFENNLDKLKGKNQEQFFDWLKQKADEDGFVLYSWLEMEAGVYLDDADMIDVLYKKTEKGYEKVDIDSFPDDADVDDSDEECFLSLKEANKFANTIPTE